MDVWTNVCQDVELIQISVQAFIVQINIFRNNYPFRKTNIWEISNL
jgi:hypothetical protein